MGVPPYRETTQQGTRYIELQVTETTNITANTSTISWALYFGLNDGGYQYDNGNKVVLQMAGQTLIDTSNIGSIQLPIGSQGRKLLQEGSFEFAHASDGTGSFAVYCQFTQTQSSAAGNNQATISDTYTCETIPRMSTFNSSTPDTWQLATAQNIVVDKYISGSKHRAYLKIGSSSLMPLGSGITTDTTIAWSPDISLASYSTTSKTFAGTLYLRTWTSDDTYIGQVTKSITLTIPGSQVRPAFASAPAVSEGSSLVPDPPYGGIYIAGKSKLTVTVTPDDSLEYGATITGCTITIAGTAYTATLSGGVYTATSATITTAGAVSIVAKLTDSRGQSASRTVSVTAYAYSAPSLTLTAYRADSSGTADESGTYLSWEVQSSFTQLTGGGSSPNNSWHLTLTATTGSTTVTIRDTSTYYSTITGLYSGLSVDDPYTITATVTDDWSSVTKTVTIETAFVLVDYHTSGRGIAFGKVAQTRDLAEFALPIQADAGIETGTPPTVIQDTPTAGSQTTTGSWVDVASITLPKAGTYIIMGSLAFTAAVGTYIQVRLDSSGGNVRDSIYIAHATTWHGSTVTDIVTVTAATVVKLQEMISATAYLRTGRLKAVRII